MLQGLARCAKALGMPLDGLPWHELRFEHTSFIRGRLLEEGAYERASVNVTLTALRGVLKHARRLGRMSGDDFARAVDWQKLPAREHPPKGRELTQTEIDALRAYWGAQDGPYGRFLACCFGLLMGAGLRASEVCRMPIAAYDPAAGTVHVLRKGGKQVVMPLGHQEIAAVDAWLVARGGFRRRIKSDALLFRVQTNDWVRPGSAELNVKALEYLCEVVATAAGCQRFQPHDLRRTFATRMGRSGMDLRAVQWFMSHESPETTARYDMRKAEEYARARRAVNIWEAPRVEPKS
jgi:site-specific recombinase XerD